MIFRFVLFLFILFLIIRFLMRFLLPVFKITRMTHQKMNEIKKQMDYMQQNNGNNKRAGKHIDGDFIDYEEIK